MLSINDRIQNLSALGSWLNKGLEEISEGKENTLSRVITKAGYENGWFTRPSVLQSLQAISGWLNEKVLANWRGQYYLSEPVVSKKVAVVMAGNVPLVNFHDFLAVLITGNKFLGKLSSHDKVLLPFLADELIRINSNWKEYIEFTDGMLVEFDAVIATGSNNTSRYFDYYFGKYPHIIRKNRHSIAVLDGTESLSDLNGLYTDIFQYYGMGCRNVSMLMIPAGYNLPGLFDKWEGNPMPTDQHKYKNNYDYYRSLYLINSTKFYDTGYVSFVQSDQLTSPLSVVHYIEYTDIQEVESYIGTNLSEIQCIVSKINLKALAPIPFGTAQCPSITDYPDGVDIIQFLLAL